ncbi:MAG: extracellular solute-binding protein [Defluviitaleaceae bacterium]|nr:extracellular solute-binding protein [Defluviitaleaceae bacterium]
MYKKLPGLCLVTVLLAMTLLLTACRQDTPAPPAAPEATPAAETQETPAPAPDPQPEPSVERVTVSAVLQINPEVVLDNNPIIAEIEERLNITLNIEAPPTSGYGERVRMMVAVGDMPDLVHYGADIFATQWAEEGLLMDVTNIRHNFPNLMANISEEQWGDTMFIPGQIHGVPRPNSADRWGFLINTTWLDNLGLEAPRTVEEFIDVARAFTFDDPTGEGTLTIGASLHANAGSMDSGVWHLMNDFLSSAFGISSWHAGLPDVDGANRLRAFRQEYIEYLELLRDLFAEGIIDQEFITHRGGTEPQEKLAMNRVGIIGASETNFVPNILERFYLDMDSFKFMPPLVREGSGRNPIYAVPPSNWMAYYINANSSPEVQDAVLRLLDFANSEEGFVLMHWGQAGVHFNSYDIQNRTIDRTPAQADARNLVTSNMFAMANAFEGRPPLLGGTTPEGIAKWQEEAGFAQSVTTRVYFGFSKMLDALGADFPDEVQTLNSLEVRFITGEISLDDLLSFRDGVYREVTRDIEQGFIDFHAANPARFVIP